MRAMTLRAEIESAINRNCAENGSDTPDFVLAQYLVDCLAAFDRAVLARNKYYGHDEPKIAPSPQSRTEKHG